MPSNKIVEIINCFFRVDSTLSWVYTLMICVERADTKMHKNIPIPIKVKGYIKLAIS